MLNFRSMDCEEEAADLKALMEQWSISEAASFSRKQTQCQWDAGSNKEQASDANGLDEIAKIQKQNNMDAVPGVDQVTSEMRRQAMHLVRCLCKHHCAVEELPAAITLFDAVCEKMARSKMSRYKLGSLENPTTFAAIVAAIVRVTLKCGTVACSQEQFSPCIDTVTEVHVIELLDGRIRLPSIVDWSRCIASRLYFLSAPDEGLCQAVQQAVPMIYRWAIFLMEKLAASSDIPPKVLALSACSLGLVNAGAMAVEEVVPVDSPSESLEEALFRKLAPSAMTNSPTGKVQVTSDALAKAACYDVEEVRLLVFHVAGQVQELI